MSNKLKEIYIKKNAHIHTRYIRYICSETYRNNRTCQKVVYLLRKIKTTHVNTLRIFRIQNANFLGYCFYMKPY